MVLVGEGLAPPVNTGICLAEGAIPSPTNSISVQTVNSNLQLPQIAFRIFSINATRLKGVMM